MVNKWIKTAVLVLLGAHLGVLLFVLFTWSIYAYGAAVTFTPANCPVLKDQGTQQTPLVVVCPNSKIASVCQAQGANYGATAVLTVPGGCTQDTIFTNSF
jgi:hypothetical protein